jgi:hypothetical protein
MWKSVENNLFTLFMSMGWDDVSELRPPTGLLFISKMFMKRHDGMIRTGKNRRTRRKTCVNASLSTYPWTDPGSTRASAVWGRRLTAWAMARPWNGTRSTAALTLDALNKPNLNLTAKNKHCISRARSVNNEQWQKFKFEFFYESEILSAINPKITQPNDIHFYSGIYFTPDSNSLQA